MKELRLQDLTEMEKDYLRKLSKDFRSCRRCAQGKPPYTPGSEDDYYYHERLILGELIEANDTGFYQDWLVYWLTKDGAKLVFNHLCEAQHKEAFLTRYKEVFGEGIATNKTVEWKDLADSEKCALDWLYDDLCDVQPPDEHWCALDKIDNLTELGLVEGFEAPDKIGYGKVYRLTQSGLELVHAQKLKDYTERIKFNYSEGW